MFLGAFGKHPGWDDHIDDIGLETDRLVTLKRMLYLEGIGAAIDSGAWENADPEMQVEGFGHVLVWDARDDVVAARLWSSRDGKGRSKYPMVVAAHCRGTGPAWVIDAVLPALERLEAACRAAAGAPAVVDGIAATRASLRQEATGLADRPPARPARRTLAAVADRPEMAGPSPRTGFHRLMYQMERDAADYLLGTDARPASGTWSRNSRLRPQHLRVPACGASPGETIDLWLALLRLLVHPAAGVMVIAAAGRPWADLIIGEPEGPQFTCLRSSPRALPLATEIPYTLDADFIERVDRLVEESRSRAEPSDQRRPGGVSVVWRSIVSRLTGRKPGE